MKKNLKIVLTIIIIFVFIITTIFSIIIFSKNTNANSQNETNIGNEIIEKQDINKIYYAKIDSKEEYYKKLKENNINITIEEKNFSKILLGKTINTTIQIEILKVNEKQKMKQNTQQQKETTSTTTNITTNTTTNITKNITKNNAKDDIQNIKIDLYMHINKELLEETKTIRIYKNENNKKELLSETPFLIINKTQIPLNLTIELELKPIKLEEYCEEKTLKDIIPKDAYNINVPKEINLNETIGKECTLILKHKAIKEFKKIILPKKYENYTIKKTTPRINVEIEK